VRTSTQIRFGLPAATAVTLAIFDLQGRSIATPLRRTGFSAGRHSIQVQTQTWQPGVYLYRLEADGRVASKKMVVVR
jgi:hypothetical protein